MRVTQYDLHRVECGCGSILTADRPAGGRPGPVGYGPNLQAFAVCLMVVQFIPAHRVVVLLESLTGAAPSVGFVHGMLARTAGLLGEVHQRIRTLITLAYAVCCDEAVPAGGLHRAVHPLPGRGPSLATFKAFVLTELGDSAVIGHDRYRNYDSTQLGTLVHQLCTAGRDR